VRYPVSFSKLRSFPNQLYDRSAIHLLGTTMDPLHDLVIGFFIRTDCEFCKRA
jgi:hypothetical protein